MKVWEFSNNTLVVSTTHECKTVLLLRPMNYVIFIKFFMSCRFSLIVLLIKENLKILKAFLKTWKLSEVVIKVEKMFTSVYSRGASDDSDIAQSFFRKEIPAQVPFLTKVSSSFSQADFFNRHSLTHVTLSELVSQLQDIPECTRIFLRFPCASRSKKTEKNTFCYNLRGDNEIEAFKLRTSGNCWSL